MAFVTKKLKKEWYLGLALRYNLSGVGEKEGDTYKEFVGEVHMPMRPFKP